MCIRAALSHWVVYSIFFNIFSHVLGNVLFLLLIPILSYLCVNFVPGIKKIYGQKQTHAQALEILLCFCRKISGFDESQLQKASAYEAMLEAAKHGIVEFIIEMTRVCPDLLWVVDEDLRGIFSHAILCRREKIFNYIFQLKGSRQLVTSHIDAFDNNMLHLAGMLAPSSELDRRPGAALQMQRELQWFKVFIPLAHFI